MKLVVGLALLLLGASLFALSFSNATRTDTVVDSSFGLEPDETYETYCHTSVFSKSILTGEVTVEDGGVNFTTYGYSAQHLENVFMDEYYSFVINPADDLYTFKFENSENGVQDSIRFRVKETWLSYFMLIPTFIGVLILVAGLVLVILSRKTWTKWRL